MEKITGMVMEINAKTCIIMTSDGDFRETVKPSEDIRLGQEIAWVPAKKPAYWRYLAVAASLLILLFCGHLYNGLRPEVVAYVTLDINPSIELGIDSEERVLKARGLNADGKELLARVRVTGQNLDRAMESLLDEAMRDSYIKPDAENVILSTVTIEDKDTSISKEKVLKAIDIPLHTSKVKADVVVEQVTPELRQEAKRTGLSSGRYLLQIKAQNRGVSITEQELKTKSLRIIQQEKRIKVIDLIPQKKVKKINTNKSNEKTNEKLNEKPKESSIKNSESLPTAKQIFDWNQRGAPDVIKPGFPHSSSPNPNNQGENARGRTVSKERGGGIQGSKNNYDDNSKNQKNLLEKQNAPEINNPGNCNSPGIGPWYRTINEKNIKNLSEVEHKLLQDIKKRLQAPVSNSKQQDKNSSQRVRPRVEDNRDWEKTE